MSAPATEKRVLVYSTPRARERAACLLGPGRVLEVEVARAILAGDVNAGAGGGFVFGPTWVARCVRTAGRIRERPRAWTVVSIEPKGTP